MAIQQHKHCVICDKAIPPDKKVCSERCEEQLNAKLKKNKRWSSLYTAFYIIFIGFVIYILIQIFLPTK
jgi:predicted nucleic acid-binding Zn ribbon protein